MNTSRRTNTRAAGGIAACRRHPRRRPRHTAGPRRVPATKRPRFMDDWVYAQISAKPVIPADPPAADRTGRPGSWLARAATWLKGERR